MWQCAEMRDGTLKYEDKYNEIKDGPRHYRRGPLRLSAGVQSPAETLHDGLSVLIESSPYACKYTNFIILHLPAIQKPFP